MFDRVLNMLLTGIYYWDFSSGIYLFKVSTKTSDRGSLNYFFWLNLVEYKEVNACWLLTFLKKLWYCFRAPWSKARHSMQRPIKWEVQNGSVTKNGISLPASLYFWGLNLRIRTCYKWLIKCTNNLNILFDTFREFLSFIRVCVFSVSIFKVTQVTLLLQGGQVLKKKRLSHL